MRMSHTEKGRYLPEAKHLYGPNMDQIIVQGKVLPIVLVDCVVESQASILGAVAHINKEVSERGLAPPLIHTLALRFRKTLNFKSLILSTRLRCPPQSGFMELGVMKEMNQIDLSPQSGVDYKTDIRVNYRHPHIS